MLENAVISATEIVGPLPPLDKHRVSHGEGHRALQPYMLATTTTKKAVHNTIKKEETSAAMQGSMSSAARYGNKDFHAADSPGTRQHQHQQRLPSLTQGHTQSPQYASGMTGEEEENVKDERTCNDIQRGCRHVKSHGRHTGDKGTTSGDMEAYNNSVTKAALRDRQRSMRRILLHNGDDRQQQQQGRRRRSCSRGRGSGGIGIGTVGLYAAQAVPVYTKPCNVRSNSTLRSNGYHHHTYDIGGQYVNTSATAVTNSPDLHLHLTTTPSSPLNMGNASGRYHRTSRSNSAAAATITTPTGMTTMVTQEYYLPACYVTPRHGFLEHWARREAEYEQWKSRHLSRSLFYTYKDGNLSGDQLAQLRETAATSRQERLGHSFSVTKGHSQNNGTERTAQRSRTVPSHYISTHTTTQNNNTTKNVTRGSHGSNGAGQTRLSGPHNNTLGNAGNERSTNGEMNKEEGDEDGASGAESNGSNNHQYDNPSALETAVVQRFERRRLRCIARQRAAAEAARTRRVSRLEHNLLERRRRARHGHAIDLPEAYYATVLEAQSQNQQQPQSHSSSSRAAQSHYKTHSSKNTHGSRERTSNATSVYDHITSLDHHRACRAAQAHTNALRESLSLARHEGRAAMRSRLARELQAARQYEREVRAAWMEGVERISRQAAEERHAARATALQEQSRALHALCELERHSYALIREQEEMERAVHQRWLRRKVPVVHHTQHGSTPSGGTAATESSTRRDVTGKAHKSRNNAKEEEEKNNNTIRDGYTSNAVALQGMNELAAKVPSSTAQPVATSVSKAVQDSAQRREEQEEEDRLRLKNKTTMSNSPRPIARISPAPFGTTSTNFLAEVKLWQASFASPNTVPPCGSDPSYRREWLQQLEQQRQAFNTQTVAQWRARYPACIAQARESNAQAKAKAAEEQRLSYTKDMQRLQLQQADKRDYVNALHDLHADQLTKLRRAREEQTLHRRRAAEEQRSAERMNETLVSTLREKEAQELHEMVSYVRQNSARSPSPQRSCGSP